MRADHYDTFAESYARENETGLFNAHYALPAMIDLAGDVTGRNILDAGCGAGPLAAALRDRGARITGVDASPAMVALAHRRLGPEVSRHPDVHAAAIARVAAEPRRQWR